MNGMEEAIGHARTWAGQMDGGHIEHKVCLTDGQESLQNRVDKDFEGYTRILDVIHATGYLWSAADAKFGNKSKDGWNWVHDAVLRMLKGRIDDVIVELDAWATGIKDSDTRWKPIERSAGYFERNRSSMKYDEYLTKGWPIATGIIEGACRHVVKDRFERSGMTWTVAGVQALLNLRCVHQNGDWDAYHKFRMARRHERVYGIKASHARPVIESDVCKYAQKREYAKAV
jgi:hypothetical protein